MWCCPTIGTTVNFALILRSALNIFASSPIVHDGVLFLFNYANKIQALNAATGDLIWEYKRDLPAKIVSTGGNLSSRNMAIYEDKLIFASTDAHIIALDVKSGKIVWDHTTADWTNTTLEVVPMADHNPSTARHFTCVIPG